MSGLVITPGILLSLSDINYFSHVQGYVIVTVTVPGLFCVSSSTPVCPGVQKLLCRPWILGWTVSYYDVLGYSRDCQSYSEVLGYSAMGCAGAEVLYPRISQNCQFLQVVVLALLRVCYFTSSHSWPSIDSLLMDIGLNPKRCNQRTAVWSEMEWGKCGGKWWPRRSHFVYSLKSSAVMFASLYRNLVQSCLPLSTEI